MARLNLRDYILETIKPLAPGERKYWDTHAVAVKKHDEPERDEARARATNVKEAPYKGKGEDGWLKTGTDATQRDERDDVKRLGEGDLDEGRWFRTSYGWAGGAKPGGGTYKHPERVAQERREKRKRRNAFDPRKSKETKNEESSIDEARAPSLKNRVSAAVSADQISHHGDGHATFRRGFFYRHGGDSHKWAGRVSEQLHRAEIKHTVVDHGEHNASFRGGAGVRSNSHWWTKVRLHDHKATNEDNNTAYERGLEDHEPRIVAGVRGATSKPFSKRFRNQAHMDKWAESEGGNHDIHQVKRAD